MSSDCDMDVPGCKLRFGAGTSNDACVLPEREALHGFCKDAHVVTDMFS